MKDPIETLKNLLKEKLPDPVILHVRYSYLRTRIINPQTGTQITIYRRPSGIDLAGKYAFALLEAIKETRDSTGQATKIREGKYRWQGHSGETGEGEWEEWRYTLPKKEFLDKLIQKIREKYTRIPTESVHKLLGFFTGKIDSP